jgi:hypothetical protein
MMLVFKMVAIFLLKKMILLIGWLCELILLRFRQHCFFKRFFKKITFRKDISGKQCPIIIMRKFIEVEILDFKTKTPNTYRVMCLGSLKNNLIDVY